MDALSRWPSGKGSLLAMGYFRAKLAQENLIKASGVPYTIVRATQFFEFDPGIAQSASLPVTGEGSREGLPPATVRLPPALMQPIAVTDVAAILADIATLNLPRLRREETKQGANEPPSSVPLPFDGEGIGEGCLRNTTIEIAGPYPIRMNDLVGKIPDRHFSLLIRFGSRLSTLDPRLDRHHRPQRHLLRHPRKRPNPGPHRPGAPRPNPFGRLADPRAFVGWIDRPRQPLIPPAPKPDGFPLRDEAIPSD